MFMTEIETMHAVVRNISMSRMELPITKHRLASLAFFCYESKQYWDINETKYVYSNYLLDLIYIVGHV